MTRCAPVQRLFFPRFFCLALREQINRAGHDDSIPDDVQHEVTHGISRMASSKPALTACVMSLAGVPTLRQSSISSSIASGSESRLQVIASAFTFCLNFSRKCLRFSVRVIVHPTCTSPIRQPLHLRQVRMIGKKKWYSECSVIPHRGHQHHTRYHGT